MIEKGYFIITDITGYTSFLTQSELDHAQHILNALFDSQLKSIKPPLVISGFRGDAILCYVPESSANDGKIIYNQINRIYDAFIAKINEMQVDPPCSCRVCSTISLLDLKIFVHFGEYLLQKVGDREELLGSDVIVAHRMMKNNVVKDTGIKSYLLLTEKAFEHLGVDAIRSDFIKHSETYDDIGLVDLLVAPLGAH
ncbi:MAG: DUF2652 domain-containing protein [Anaerolineales bacterium]|jgi:hypothetical protein